MRFLRDARFGMALAGVVASAFLGQWARAADAPATQPTAAPIFVPPVFTEDFESGELNKNVWDVRIGAITTGAAAQPTVPAIPGVTITVQHDVVAHGKSALRIHYLGPLHTYAVAVLSHLSDSLKDHFFGRAYVLFPTAPPNDHDALISCGNVGFPISNFFEIGLRNNKSQLSYQQNSATDPRGETQMAGPQFPVGKWFCLEWEFNANPSTMKMWIDGARVFDYTVGKTEYKFGLKGDGGHLVSGFVDFAFGLRVWGDMPNSYDVYYDDIALGAGRIGPVK